MKVEMENKIKLKRIKVSQENRKYVTLLIM